MVLLTSSTVSVIISSGGVCAFTFLLFLCGYNLQQQTVRSLQEALRAPPPPKVVPTLPPQFQTEGGIAGSGETSENFTGELPALTVLSTTDERDEDVLQPGAAPEILLSSSQQGVAESSGPGDRHAYILALTQPSSLCSALLFNRQEMTSQEPANLIFMYPSTWESSSDPNSIAALKLLRSSEEKYSIRLHPVVMNGIWLGASIESQLLGEFQTHRWIYDRILYLKSPGLALDVAALDEALRFSNLKASWTKFSTKSAVGDELNPDILLFSGTKGMLSPSGELRKLTMNAISSDDKPDADDIDGGVVAESAAYVIFDEKEMDQQEGTSGWYAGLLERFEKERRQVCAGSGLLDDSRIGQADLRLQN